LYSKNYLYFIKTVPFCNMLVYIRTAHSEM
jgi:hypothetical protein